MYIQNVEESNKMRSILPNESIWLGAKGVGNDFELLNGKCFS